jgi:hypothetical protein
MTNDILKRALIDSDEGKQAAKFLKELRKLRLQLRQR